MFTERSEWRSGSQNVTLTLASFLRNEIKINLAWIDKAALPPRNLIAQAKFVFIFLDVSLLWIIYCKILVKN